MSTVTTGVETGLPEPRPYWPLRSTGRFAKRNDVTTAAPEWVGRFSQTTAVGSAALRFPVIYEDGEVDVDGEPMSFAQAVAAGKRLAEAFKSPGHPEGNQP